MCLFPGADNKLIGEFPFTAADGRVLTSADWIGVTLHADSCDAKTAPLQELRVVASAEELRYLQEKLPLTQSVLDIAPPPAAKETDAAAGGAGGVAADSTKTAVGARYVCTLLCTNPKCAFLEWPGCTRHCALLTERLDDGTGKCASCTVSTKTCGPWNSGCRKCHSSTAKHWLGFTVQEANYVLKSLAVESLWHNVLVCGGCGMAGFPGSSGLTCHPFRRVRNGEELDEGSWDKYFEHAPGCSVGSSKPLRRLLVRLTTGEAKYLAKVLPNSTSEISINLSVDVPPHGVTEAYRTADARFVCVCLCNNKECLHLEFPGCRSHETLLTRKGDDGEGYCPKSCSVSTKESWSKCTRCKTSTTTKQFVGIWTEEVRCSLGAMSAAAEVLTDLLLCAGCGMIATANKGGAVVSGDISPAEWERTFVHTTDCPATKGSLRTVKARLSRDELAYAQNRLPTTTTILTIVPSSVFATVEAAVLSAKSAIKALVERNGLAGSPSDDITSEVAEVEATVSKLAGDLAAAQEDTEDDSTASMAAELTERAATLLAAAEAALVRVKQREKDALSAAAAKLASVVKSAESVKQQAEECNALQEDGVTRTLGQAAAAVSKAQSALVDANSVGTPWDFVNSRLISDAKEAVAAADAAVAVEDAKTRELRSWLRGRVGLRRAEQRNSVLDVLEKNRVAKLADLAKPAIAKHADYLVKSADEAAELGPISRTVLLAAVTEASAAPGDVAAKFPPKSFAQWASEEQEAIEELEEWLEDESHLPVEEEQVPEVLEVFLAHNVASLAQFAHIRAVVDLLVEAVDAVAKFGPINGEVLADAIREVAGTETPDGVPPAAAGEAAEVSAAEPVEQATPSPTAAADTDDFDPDAQEDYVELNNWLKTKCKMKAKGKRGIALKIMIDEGIEDLECFVDANIEDLRAKFGAQGIPKAAVKRICRLIDEAGKGDDDEALPTVRKYYKLDSWVPSQGGMSIVRFAYDTRIRPSPVVALKCTRDKDSWLKEIAVRRHLPADAAVQIVEDGIWVAEPHSTDWHVFNGELSKQWRGTAAGGAGGRGQEDDEGGPWYVLALEKGERSMEELTNNPKMSKAQNLVVQGAFGQACNAVSQLHGVGWAHTDLKPANFICVDGMWKLADLDSCVKLGQGLMPTAWTCAYAPPELARWRKNNTPFVVTPAYDVYQLGLIGAALLLGEDLFHNEESTLDRLAEPNFAVPLTKFGVMRRSKEYRAHVALIEAMIHVDPTKRKPLVSQLTPDGEVVPGRRGVLDDKFFGGGMSTTAVRAKVSQAREEGTRLAQSEAFCAISDQLDRVEAITREAVMSIDAMRREQRALRDELVPTITSIAADGKEAAATLGRLELAGMSTLRAVKSASERAGADAESIRSAISEAMAEAGRSREALKSELSEKLAAVPAAAERLAHLEKSGVQALEAVQALVQDLESRGDATNGQLEEVLLRELDKANRARDEQTAMLLGSLREMEDRLSHQVAATLRTVVDIADSEVPRVVLMLPFHKKVPEKTVWYKKIAQLPKQFMVEAGLKQAHTLVFCCEGNTFAPHISCSKPAHEGFEFTTDGPTLVRLAPAVKMAGGLLRLASGLGKIAGLPLPSEIPFIGSLDDLDATLVSRVETYSEWITDEALQSKVESLGGMVEEAEETLEGVGERQAELPDVADKVAKVTGRVSRDTYEAIKSLIDGHLPDLRLGDRVADLSKVVLQETGQVCWVCDAHFEKSVGLVHAGR